MTTVSSTSATTGSTATTTSTSLSAASSTTATGSATQALLTQLGVSGNINATSLADQLSQAQYAGQVDQLNARNTSLTTQISEASTLKNMVQSLASSLDSLITGGQLSSAPQIANSSVASVSTGSVQGSGTSTLEVDTLARGQTIASPTIASSTATVGSGSLTIAFGSISGSTFTPGSQSAVTITVAQGATLSDVATQINNAGAGVHAYVATNSNGQQLVISGQQGAANAFTVSASEAAGDPGLAQFAWAPGNSGGAQLAAPATDASYKLDGVARTSPSNTISDAAPGISLNLTGTNPGNPTTISFSDPTQAVTTGMNDLVTALNSIVSQLNTDTAPGGALASNQGATALQRALSGLSTATIMPHATTGQPATLGDLGLTTNRDGTFSLDTTVLNKALHAQPQAVAAMFTTGLYGVYGTIAKISQAVSDTTSATSLAGSISSLNTQESTIAKQLAKIATQQAALRAQLVTQYAALNAVVTADKSTQSFLTDQIALWTKPASG
jgi:flagellar hook-associated protein 2